MQVFATNFHTLRKAKGYSQEELAIRLHVVRQTVSKWEKGISAPDADMLSRIADIFEVSINELVEGKIEAATEANAIVEQLSRINEQLIISNYRSLRAWRAVAIVLIAFVSISIFSVLLFTFFKSNNAAINNSDSVFAREKYAAQDDEIIDNQGVYFTASLVRDGAETSDEETTIERSEEITLMLSNEHYEKLVTVTYHAYAP